MVSAAAKNVHYYHFAATAIYFKLIEIIWPVLLDFGANTSSTRRHYIFIILGYKQCSIDFSKFTQIYGLEEKLT